MTHTRGIWTIGSAQLPTVALLLASAASPVHAEPATGAAVLEDIRRSPPGSASDKSLDTIVVTATKRETNLQRTPIAISVANSAGARRPPRLQPARPRRRLDPEPSRRHLRGAPVGADRRYPRHRSVRPEPDRPRQGVGVYVDGVYLGRSQGLNAALFDVERIEVLRGPQGTLFGRNTEGGAVSIVTKAPTGVFGGRGTAGVGNYGQREGEIHLDLPAFANIAIKVDGVIEHQDATVKNPLAASLAGTTTMSSAAASRRAGRRSTD